jgi:hypothetical protein
MGTKKLTVLQHKKNEQDKKRKLVNKEKQLYKREKKLLEKIRILLPEELVRYIYSFVNNDIKYDLSFYKRLFTKYIYDSKNLSIVFKGYTHQYTYCTFYKTAALLKAILYKIPFEILEKYIHFGTPSKYFNVAFPFEPDIKEYIGTNYKDADEKNQRKNYIFEILDLLSFFATKTNQWYAKHSINKKNKYLSSLKFVNEVYNYIEFNNQTEEIYMENEMIFKKIVFSIINLSTF